MLIHTHTHLMSSSPLRKRVRNEGVQLMRNRVVRIALFGCLGLQASEGHEEGGSVVCSESYTWNDNTRGVDVRCVQGRETRVRRR
jgi:hypothetical protein